MSTKVSYLYQPRVAILVPLLWRLSRRASTVRHRNPSDSILPEVNTFGDATRSICPRELGMNTVF